MEMWHETRMSFGWEVYDMIYGALICSADTAKQRLNAYLSGIINRLEELEEDRLYFGNIPEGKSGLSWNELSFQRSYSVI